MIILIVDDNRDVVELLKTHLLDLGHIPVSIAFDKAPEIFFTNKEFCEGVIINADPYAISSIMELRREIDNYNNKIPTIVITCFDYNQSPEMLELKESGCIVCPSRTLWEQLPKWLHQTPELQKATTHQ